jgi:hypothetical protein
MLFTALAGLAVACTTSADDGSATGDDDLRVKPKDSENWSNLVVALPTGSCLPGNSCTRPLGTNPSVSVDGASVAIGATTRLRPGDHTITANGGAKKITLTAGQARTFVLPVARSKCTAAALGTVPATDFGQSVTLANAACPTAVTGSSAAAAPTFSTATLDPFYTPNCTNVLTKFGQPTPCSLYAPYTVYSVRSQNGACVNITPINAQSACNAAMANDWAWAAGVATNGSLLATDQAFIPDTYSVSVAGTAKSFSLAEGDLTDIPLALPVVGTVPNVFATKVSFADPRELPNAAGMSTTITSSCAGDRAYTVAANATGTLDLKAFVAPSCVYTLRAAGRTADLNQAATNAFTLQRLDVDDVEVTRENGSVYAARGTFELFFNGTRVVGPLPTNTGIDALPGTYELVISYATADGPKTQRQTLTL